MRESDSQRGDWLLEVAGVDLPVSCFGDRDAASMAIEDGRTRFSGVLDHRQLLLPNSK